MPGSRSSKALLLLAGLPMLGLLLAGSAGAQSVALALEKVDGVDPVQAGSELVYVLTVTNLATSTEDALNVTITETYDPNVTFVSAVPPPTEGNDTWNVGGLTPGQSTNVLVRVQVASPLPDGTVLGNTAQAVADQAPVPVLASEATEVDSSTRISAVRTDTPDPIAAGGLLTYQILVGNDVLANEVLTNVTLTETYDPNVSFVSAVPPPTSGDDVWDLGDLVPGAFAAVVITVQVASPLLDGTVVLGSGVVSADQDSVQLTESTTVNSSTMLSLTMSDSVDPVLPGDLVTYGLEWANDASVNGLATNAKLMEIYPPGLTFVSAVPPPDAGDNQWDLGTLAPGDSGTILVTAQVTAPPGFVLDNRAVLVSDQETANASEPTAVTFPEPPSVDVKLNGSDGTILVGLGEPVVVELSLDPGTFAGETGDYLIGLIDPSGQLLVLLFTPLTLVEFSGLSFQLPALGGGKFLVVFAVDTVGDGALLNDLALDLGGVVFQ